jgi:hypothetical protein
MTPAPMLRRLRGRRAAFSLPELLVTSSLITVIGGLVFLSLNAGVRLFGKNVAVNLPYQASRAAFDVLSRDVHASPAVPRLIDPSLVEVSGSGPAAGVALRRFVGGPCVVASDTAATATLVEIKRSVGFTPQAGDLLTLPAFRIERTIVSVSDLGSTWQVAIDAGLGAALNDTANCNFVAFFTRRIGYVVVGNELRRHPDLSQPGTFHVVSRGITNQTPFSFSASRYLSVALTANDPGSSARGWKGVDANLTFSIACRATTPLAGQ